MGQRLVINISDGDGILASAYYRWGAYTLAAANYLNQIIPWTCNHLNEWEHAKDRSERVLAAVHMLQRADAKLSDSARMELYMTFPRLQVTIIERGNSGNTGVIDIGKKEIETLQKCAEIKVHINMASGRLYFGAYRIIHENDVEDWGVRSLRARPIFVQNADDELFSLWFKKWPVFHDKILPVLCEGGIYDLGQHGIVCCID